ncbi:MAG TPA: stage II sporulation protein M [Steroidobacteraceae bacterium]
MNLLVDSVSGVDVALAVAGPGARAFAFLVDFVFRAILGIAWYVVAAPIYYQHLTLRPPDNAGGVWFTFVIGPAVAIFFLYHIVLEVLMRGRTPGKRLASVVIVARDGATANTGALVVRNLFRVVDSLPLMYGVGLLTSILSADHVRIGDLAAGTLLVYDDRDAHLPAHAGDRATRWAAADARARRLGRGRARDAADANQIVDDYRLLAHELARARRRAPDSDEREYLEGAYARAHATLHYGSWNAAAALVSFFRDQLPEVVLWLRPYILWVTLLFVLSVLAGGWMVHTYPALIRLFASPELIATVERGELWTHSLLNVVPSSVLSLQILTNNIVVSVFAYCAGFLFGLGTFYIVGLNGLTLGAVFAFTAQHGLDGELFAFVVAHGCVEISALCLSGAAGAAVGDALIRPNTPRRADAFRAAALRSGKLLLACALLLVGTGLIEGYISPNPRFGFAMRVFIGVGYWILMVALLRGWFFRGMRRLEPVAT